MGARGCCFNYLRDILPVEGEIDIMVSHVLKRIEDSTLFLTLNNIAKANSMSATMVKELQIAVDLPSFDDLMSAIVIMGNGMFFCNGMDLSTGGNILEDEWKIGMYQGLDFGREVAFGDTSRERTSRHNPRLENLSSSQVSTVRCNKSKPTSPYGYDAALKVSPER